jgi:hypothetical protein
LKRNGIHCASLFPLRPAAFWYRFGGPFPINHLKSSIMVERNQQQDRSQGNESQQQEQQSPKQDVSRQHKTGEDNPQSGSSWDNYQTRTLSGNQNETRDRDRDRDIL